MRFFQKTPESFQKTVFDHHFTILSEKRFETRSLSLGVWLKVGTRHESKHQAGVCHFLEHMVFKGTKNRNALQIARAIDAVGGEFNAFTAREHTCFHLLLLDQDLALGLDILSDILLNSTLDPKEFERERDVILQEIALVEESPEELALDLFLETVFSAPGLGQSILGSEDQVRQMNRSTVMQFFYDYYHPAQVVLTAVGPIEHTSLLKHSVPLQAQIWPNRSQVGLPLQTTSACFYSVKQWNVRNTEQVHLVWGVPGLGCDDPDRLVAVLMNIYLGGSMSSLLFQTIREQHGLAYTVYSSWMPFIDTGVLAIYVATRMKDVVFCYRLVQQCVAQLQEKGLSIQELQDVKNYLKNSLWLSLESVESRMLSLGKSEIFLGQPLSLEELCQKIDQITLEAVQKMAHRIFGQTQQSLLVLGARPSPSVLNQLNIHSIV